MSEEIKNDNTVAADNESVKLTDEQVHNIYDTLSEVDKKSADDLNAAEKETDDSDYTSDNNTEIDKSNIIPGIKDVNLDITDTIEESQENIKDALTPYELDENSTVQMLNLIEDYKKGNKNDIYSKLPAAFKHTVDMMIEKEIKSSNTVNINKMRNATAGLIIESFINDAKMSASVEEFSSEMNKTVGEMTVEYDSMINKAIEDTFSKIDEIKDTNPEQAKRLEAIKKAFESASTFEDQLNYAKNTTSYVLRKSLNDYHGTVIRFNTKVNNNTFGVKVPKIEEIVPIINKALPKYTITDIKKFIISICRTSKDPKDLAGTAYNYRLISNIYRYKFTNIDEKGKVIFENISKVIDEIKS